MINLIILGFTKFGETESNREKVSWKRNLCVKKWGNDKNNYLYDGGKDIPNNKS